VTLNADGRARHVSGIVARGRAMPQAILSSTGRIGLTPKARCRPTETPLPFDGGTMTRGR
jgi:hypothetical protein